MEKCLTIVLLLITLCAPGCGDNTDANIASHNLSVAADQFQINRRVIFYNGITGEYILSVEGKCSLEKDNMDNQLELTCKISPTTYKKHFLGLSDNVTYFAEQIEEASVNPYHYKVIFKPQSIIPDIDLKTSITD